MAVLYCPDPHSGSLIPSEIQHIQALRLHCGDEITLADGKGTFYQARLTSKKGQFTFEILSQTAEPARDYGIHLVIAPTKNPDRMEWLCEKLIEMGIDEITFVFTEYSERRKIDLQRFERLCIAAMKQSQRASLPRLSQTVFSQEFLLSLKGQKWLLDAKGISPKAENVAPHTWFSLLVGPEGGWHDKEYDMCQSLGFECVRVGTHRLRTETAGLAACMAIHLFKL